MYRAAGGKLRNRGDGPRLGVCVRHASRACICQPGSTRFNVTRRILPRRYFRLIEPPAPSTVRPQALLERALAHVLEEEARGADYVAFTNDQLKSIRQDLVVQCIRNEFTVRRAEKARDGRWL